MKLYHVTGGITTDCAYVWAEDCAAAEKIWKAQRHSSSSKQVSQMQLITSKIIGLPTDEVLLCARRRR